MVKLNPDKQGDAAAMKFASIVIVSGLMAATIANFASLPFYKDVLSYVVHYDATVMRYSLGSRFAVTSDLIFGFLATVGIISIQRRRLGFALPLWMVVVAACFAAVAFLASDLLSDVVSSQIFAHSGNRGDATSTARAAFYLLAPLALSLPLCIFKKSFGLTTKHILRAYASGAMGMAVADVIAQSLLGFVLLANIEHIKATPSFGAAMTILVNAIAEASLAASFALWLLPARQSTSLYLRRVGASEVSRAIPTEGTGLGISAEGALFDLLPDTRSYAVAVIFAALGGKVRLDATSSIVVCLNGAPVRTASLEGGDVIGVGASFYVLDVSKSSLESLLSTYQGWS